LGCTYPIEVKKSEDFGVGLDHTTLIFRDSGVKSLPFELPPSNDS